MANHLAALLLSSVLLLCGCASEPPLLGAGDMPPPPPGGAEAGNPPILEIGINATAPKLAAVHATVLDNATGAPLEGAIVFYGGHSPEELRCRTGADGKCTIQSKYLVQGEHVLRVLRKGYFPANLPVNLSEGGNSITIYLSPQPSAPQDVSLSGTLIEKIYAPGTKSEDHHFKLRTAYGSEEFLFNEVGENWGFDSYVNRQVEITGYRCEGFYSWAHRISNGTCVESITEK
jgi:hypothetical protein